MSAQTDKPYVENGPPAGTQQAEQSTANPAATNVQMRILIELQVLSFILREACSTSEDLAQMRRDIAASIT